MTSLRLLVGLFSASIFAYACAAPGEQASEGNDTAEDELVGLARADVVGTLAYGAKIEVPSSPGRRYRAVTFAGKTGDAVEIWVRSAADARAWLLGPDFRKTLASNDDADATTKNARLTFTLTSDGEHTIAFREAANAATTFAVSLAKAGPAPSAGTDVCAKHPWPMAYGCRDRQGRSSGTGPTRPVIGWQAQLPSPCAVQHLLVDAAGTAFVSQDSCQDTFTTARGGGFTAVRADGTIAWKTSLLGRLKDLALGSDDALYGYVMGSRPIAPWTSAVVHGFYRFDPATGAGTKLFSEEIGSDRMPRTITPLPDGRVQFSVPADPLEYPESVTPSAKIYDPKTKTLSDATTSISTPWLRATLADGSTLTSRTTYDQAQSLRLFWVEKRDAAGALSWKTDSAQLLGVGPQGTTFANMYGQYGDGGPAAPGRLLADGTLVPFPLATPKSGSPWTMAVGPDDALVLGHRKSASPANTIAKYTKTGALVFEAPVFVEGGNIAIDAAGNIYGGGAAFGPTGARLEAPAKPWVPALDRVAVGPNGTLFAAWTRPNSTGTIYKLVDAAP